MGIAIDKVCVSTLQQAVYVINAKYQAMPIPQLITAQIDGTNIHLYARDYIVGQGYGNQIDLGLLVPILCDTVGPYPFVTFDPSSISPSVALSAFVAGFTVVTTIFSLIWGCKQVITAFLI